VRTGAETRAMFFMCTHCGTAVDVSLSRFGEDEDCVLLVRHGLSYLRNLVISYRLSNQEEFHPCNGVHILSPIACGKI